MAHRKSAMLDDSDLSDPRGSPATTSGDDSPLARPANPRRKRRVLAKVERDEVAAANAAKALNDRLKTITGAEEDPAASETWKRLREVERRVKKYDGFVTRREASFKKLTDDTNAAHERVRAALPDCDNLLVGLKEVGKKLPEQLAEDLMSIFIFEFGSLDMLRDMSPQAIEALKSIELEHYKDSNPLPLVEETREKINRLHKDMLDADPEARKADQQRFEEALAQHEERNSRLDKKCTELNGKLVLERSAHNNTRSELEAVRSRAKVAAEDHDKTVELYKKSKQSNRELASRQQDLQELSQSLQEQVQSLEAGMTELREQRDETVASLEERLDEIESERLELRGRLAEMSNAEAEWDSRRSRLAQEAEGARGAHEAVSRELSIVRRHAGELEGRLSAMTHEKQGLEAARAIDGNKMEAFKKRIAALGSAAANAQRAAAADLSASEQRRQTETEQLQQQISMLVQTNSGEAQQHRQEIQHQEEQYGRLAEQLEQRCKLAESQCEALRAQLRDQDAVHAHEVSVFRSIESICDAVEADHALHAEQLGEELMRERATSGALREEAGRVRGDLCTSEHLVAQLRQELSESLDQTGAAKAALGGAEVEHKRTREGLRAREAAMSELERAHGEEMGGLRAELALGGQHMCLLFNMAYGVEPEAAELGRVLYMLTDPAARGQVSEVTNAFWGVNPPWTSCYGPPMTLADGLSGRLLQLYSMSLRDPVDQNWLPTVLHIVSRITAAVGLSHTSQAGPLMYFITGKLGRLRPRLVAPGVGPMLLSIALRECMWKVEQRFHNAIGEQRVDFASLDCEEPVLRSFNNAVMDGRSRRQQPVEQQLRGSPDVAFHEFTHDDGTRVGVLAAEGSRWFMLLDLNHYTMRLVSRRLARVDKSSWPQEAPAIVSPHKPHEDIFIFHGAPHATSIFWSLHLVQ